MKLPQNAAPGRVQQCGSKRYQSKQLRIKVAVGSGLKLLVNGDSDVRKGVARLTIVVALACILLNAQSAAAAFEHTLRVWLSPLERFFTKINLLMHNNEGFQAATLPIANPDKMNPWIAKNFADVPVVVGNAARRNVEMPALVKDATGCCDRYVFHPIETKPPDDRRIAFVNVISQNGDASGATVGAGLNTSNYHAGNRIYISNMLIDMHWPVWENYTRTNFDGVVLDGNLEFYAEDLTIRNWNADAGVDIKSEKAQFVRTRVEGPGHRALRFWQPGPHYLVDSEITGDVHTFLWFQDCTKAELNIYNTTFNGASTAPASMIDCNKGEVSDLALNYLTVDPKSTGEMHPMFGEDASNQEDHIRRNQP